MSIRAQKINSSTIKTFITVIANFQIEDKANKLKFFQEIFLIADIKLKVILKTFFLKSNNMDILFGKKILI